MNFEPDVVLAPQHGNNADARAVTAHVMNDNTPTPGQWMALAGIFDDHKTAVRHSAAGFHTTHGRLADGSQYEIVSNSGLHTIMLWPAGDEVVTPLEGSFFAVPSSYFAGLRAEWDPKFSGHWAFRGATAAPEALKSVRKITDEPDLQQHPGNLTWFSDGVAIAGRPIVVSWYGRATRYGKMDYHGRHRQFSINSNFPSLYSPASSSTGIVAAAYDDHRSNWANAFKPAVWTNGVKHQTVKMVGEDQENVPVLSAALRFVDDSSLEVWVVSHDTQLRMFKGTIGDIYAPGPIVLTEQFAIDFAVNNTAVGEYWEALQQPLYFNASCTQAAGIVVARKGSTTNAAAAAVIPPSAPANAFVAVLVEVDLATEATSFDASEGLVSISRSQTHTGAYAGSGFGSAPAEARTTDVTYHDIRYCAVDYVGDQLTVVLADYQRVHHFEEEGSWEYAFDGDVLNPAVQDKTMTCTVRTQYRIYRLHDDATLLEKDSGVVALGTITAEAEGRISSIPPFREGRGSGAREENVSADLFWHVGVEGGDLRAGMIIVGEFVEVGESAYADTFTNAWGEHLDPAARDSTATFAPNFDTLHGIVISSSGERLPILRFIAARDGVVLDTSPALVEASRRAYSLFGLLAQDNPTPTAPIHMPFSPSGGGTKGEDGFWVWRDILTSTTNVACDFFATSTQPRQAGSRLGYANTNPFTSCGRPYVNTCAFSPDGLYGFYNIGSAYRNPPDTSFDWDSVGAFIIDGASFPLVGTKYHPEGGDDASLASPVFIDLVPENA